MKRLSLLFGLILLMLSSARAALLPVLVTGYQGQQGLTRYVADSLYAPKSSYWDLGDVASARSAWVPLRPHTINSTAQTLASTPRPTLPAGTILYVSNSTSNGFTSGSDSATFAQAQSKSTPTLSIKRAIDLAATNSLSGNYRVIVNDGTYAENDSNRVVPRYLFTNYIRIESRTGRPADVIVTNNTGSSSSPINTTTSAKWSNYWFHGLTFKAISTAYPAMLLQTTASDTTSLGSNLWLTDCALICQQPPNGTNNGCIQISGDAGFSGLYMDNVTLRCATTPSASLGKIWAWSVTRSTGAGVAYTNWMLRRVDWSGLSCGDGTGLRNINGLAVVNCIANAGFSDSGLSLNDYGLIIGSDDVTLSQGVTNVYVLGGSFTNTGNTGHGIVIGGASNVVVDLPTVTCSGSSLQGIVVKGSTDVDVRRARVVATGSSMLNAFYDKGSTRCYWFDNYGSTTYGVAFRQGDNPSISSCIGGAWVGGNLSVPGTNGSNILVDWGTPSYVAVPAPALSIGNTYSSPAANRGNIRGTAISSSGTALAAMQAAWLSAGLAGENYNDAR